ncbi:PGPGW domain-containing protein [Roseospira navarrensis]|nr:PGPGW domain-containing protein [Roseospira navarrensis]
MADDPAPRHPVRRAINIAVGSVLLVVGIIIAPTPIPIGLFLIAIGLFILTRDSERAREAVRWVRRRVGALDRGLRKVEPRLPRGIARVIHVTDPNAPAGPSRRPEPAPASSG